MPRSFTSQFHPALPALPKSYFPPRSRLNLAQSVAVPPFECDRSLNRFALVLGLASSTLVACNSDQRRKNIFAASPS